MGPASVSEKSKKKWPGTNTRRLLVIIDIHTHPVFSGMPIHPGLDELSKAYYGREMLRLTLSDFIEELDRSGVDKVVLLTACWKNQPVRPRNQAVAELLRQYPQRFIGFASFDPNTGQQAVEEIEYAVNELGFSGVKSVAQNVEIFYNDPRCYPIYERVQELRIPILFHTGPAFLHTETKFGDSTTIDDVALEFPQMKIVLAHMGMHRYLDAHALLVRHANVYADLSFWPLHPSYRHLIPWSMLEQTVPDKILLGSDFPVGQTPGEAIQAVKTLPVSDKLKSQILGENAARLLGL
jgi:predicted TIM-barrel fold metal-dependent hydrolase